MSGSKTMVPEKVFIDAESLLLDSYRLAAQVIRANFEPSFMIAIWRGGAPIGIAVQEFLKYMKAIFLKQEVLQPRLVL